MLKGWIRKLDPSAGQCRGNSHKDGSCTDREHGAKLSQAQTQRPSTIDDFVNFPPRAAVDSLEKLGVEILAQKGSAKKGIEKLSVHEVAAPTNLVTLLNVEIRYLLFD